ncbi:MAG: trypsin-like peptidase domain-containing protein [Holosporales bacterium]|jgi:serine protease Do|nr:trypsin-like peptidase domain-containing protein [Holosporales bacterium]
MSILRMIVYALVISGSISAWEYSRKCIFSIIDRLKYSAEDNIKERRTAESREITPPQEPTQVITNDHKPAADDKNANGFLSFDKGFEEIANKAQNSVVNIAALKLVEEDDSSGNNMFEDFPFDYLFRDFYKFLQKKKKPKRAHALGSGFITAIKDGKLYIVTNNHVIEKANKIVIYLNDKTELNTKVYATDTRTDIAVLTADLKGQEAKIENLKTVKWGNSDNIKEGNWVVAIGNPFGFGNTVTAGIVSAKGRDIGITKDSSTNLVDDLIQHSAAINMGNSGGCLLNIYGEVIGINCAIISNSGGNIGLGFAIPSNIGKKVVTQLISDKKVTRGWIGVSVQSVGAKQAESVGLTKKTLDTSKVFGAFISKIVPESPAAKAGLKVGDIIIGFDGVNISEKNSLRTVVGDAKIGNTVKIKVWRQRENEEEWEAIDSDITIGDFDKALKEGLLNDKDDLTSQKEVGNAEEVIEPLGITVAPLPEQYKNEYPDVKVIVTNVAEDRSFYGSVFVVGDGIIKANNVKISNVKQLQKATSDFIAKKENKGKPMSFIVIRNGEPLIIAATVNIDEEKNDKEVTKKENKKSSE